MTISILIPTYNCPCLSLCKTLDQEITQGCIDAEIIVMDDISTDPIAIKENEGINHLPNCRCITLPQKAGIARIRNLLSDEAKGDILLFLDADVFPVRTNFIKNYLAAINGYDMLCGGLTYRKNGPIPISPIRYAYGMRYETAHTHFMSLNFCIRRDVFRQVRFDENFSQYGHEDTFFGLRIKEDSYRHCFIENPVYHDNGDTSEQFLAKTRKAIENLARHEDKLEKASRLLQVKRKIQRFRLHRIAALPYLLFRKYMERNILSPSPSLTIYNLYKIGYLLSLKQ